MEWLSWLFEQGRIEKDPWLVGVQRSACVLTFIAHMAIGVWTIIRRNLIASAVHRSVGAVFVVWGALIIVSGITYFSNFVIFTYPFHRFDTLFHFMTAVTSAGALFTVPILDRSFRNQSHEAEVQRRLVERLHSAVHRAKISPELAQEVMEALVEDLDNGKV